MHHSLISFLALTMVAALALGGASCADSPTSPSAAAGASDILTNTLNPPNPSNPSNASPPQAWVDSTWTLVSIQAAGQAPQPAPNGVSYELTTGDNRVSTKADCNTCVGSLAINGTTVTIGPLLACTRAACPTMEFEKAYVTLLAGESNAQLDGNSLTLSSPRGVLRFRR